VITAANVIAGLHGLLPHWRWDTGAQVLVSRMARARRAW